MQIIKNHVNKDGSGSHARYSSGMWTCLAAVVCLFFGSAIVLFTCFGARRKSRATKTTADGPYEYAGNGYSGTHAAKKKRFGIF